MLKQGSIANSKLSNSSVNYGGVTLSLGADTTAFDLSDATNYPISLTGTITNAQLAGSIANAKLSNSTVSYGGECWYTQLQHLIYKMLLLSLRFINRHSDSYFR